MLKTATLVKLEYFSRIRLITWRGWWRRWWWWKWCQWQRWETKWRECQLEESDWSLISSSYIALTDEAYFSRGFINKWAVHRGRYKIDPNEWKRSLQYKAYSKAVQVVTAWQWISQDDKRRPYQGVDHEVV
jgi:hypothetical protein